MVYLERWKRIGGAALGRGLVLLLLWASAGVASATDLEGAMQAFRQGDYAAALDDFMALREAGRTGDAIDYNIAVCHYRLGHLEQAAAAFKTISPQSRLAALAEYNLALIAAKQDRDAESRRHLARVLRGDADPRLNRLATALRARLDARRLPLQWQAQAALRGGYNDNVLLVADTSTSASDAGDGFHQLSAFGSLTYGAGRWHSTRRQSGCNGNT